MITGCTRRFDPQCFEGKSLTEKHDRILIGGCVLNRLVTVVWNLKGE